MSGPSLPTLIVAIAMDKLMEVGDAKITLLHPSKKTPMWTPPEQSQRGTLIGAGWETGLSCQQVRMDFAHAFGFVTPKEVEFLPGKRGLI